MLLIYTQKITPRIVYTFKHICTNILGIPIKFTVKIEEFIAHEGMKLSYGKQALGNELFVQKVALLMEQGLSEVEIKIQPWGEDFCFFPVSENSALPFDIFAASFFLLSRYEEYLPHVKDDMGRFPASESVAYQEGFLQSPVVDIWAYKFKEVLQERFPEISFEKRKFHTRAIIAVEHVFSFQNKGFLRSLAGMHLDIIKFQFQKVIDRIQVLLRLKKDPLNIFGDLIAFIKEHKVPIHFMFQLSDFSIYDRNINYNRNPYRSIIKYVGDYAKVGLIPGYFAYENFKILRKEKLRLENTLHTPLERVINVKYNLNIPEFYTFLTELEIPADYSMGYPEALGFRAGTCNPFLFYDINTETTLPLKVHPYIFNSNIVEHANFEKFTTEIGKILLAVKKVDGSFKAIFKNQDFSEYSNHKDYYTLLKQIYEVR
ncbi:polysaccharide deacetylase family protein [Salegentibacter maritimus]|uniref:polysaccharide deacetylase family protein n=1 Tax=Salegentibacter maritimus TaxID=2794347 RepID=UPI0018E42677|nr:polysaccharide deacetylase family protein [Salegentibacter maritimus]MBI6115574.1 polysaccharide deacetylase family protein [Salegentibacter maritimus]